MGWGNVREGGGEDEQGLAEAQAALAAGEADAVAEELGDLRFAVVNLLRKNTLDAETVLAASTEKFIARFHEMERELKAAGQKLGELDLAAMDEVWNRVKRL